MLDDMVQIANYTEERGILSHKQQIAYQESVFVIVVSYIFNPQKREVESLV